MVKAITPFSTRAKEGATDAPLGDFVTVDQTITSTANAGFYDKNTGKFEGVLGSDKLFTIDAIHEAVPNSGIVLSPQGATNNIDMTGFNDILIAVKPSNGGAFAISGVMGSASNFANLSPLTAGNVLRGNIHGNLNEDDIKNIFADASETLIVDVWNIFIVSGKFIHQKALQFRIVNNSGAESDIEFAYMRMV